MLNSLVDCYIVFHIYSMLYSPMIAVKCDWEVSSYSSHVRTTIILKLKFPIKNSVNDNGKDDLIWILPAKWVNYSFTINSELIH